MKHALLIFCSLFLLLAFAPPALTVSTTQRDARAELVIGSFDAAPTTLAVTLPPGWTGAPGTVVVSGTVLLTFALVRGVGAPQLGVVTVEGGGLAGHAYLAGAVVESAPPLRPSRVLLALIHTEQPAPRVKRWLAMVRR